MVTTRVTTLAAALLALVTACSSRGTPAATPAAPEAAGAPGAPEAPAAPEASEAPVAPEAPPGPRSYAVEVTIADAEYAPTATVSTDESVRAGAAAVLHVELRFPTTAPRGLTEGYLGFPVGHPGPVTFTAPDGVVVDPVKVRLTGNPTVTATSERVAFDVRVTAAAAGATPMSAQLSFALCDQTRCDVRGATLRWTLEVLP